MTEEPTAAALHLRVGASFGDRYDVVRAIKEGGMGAVYEVVHRATRRRSALKIMLPSVVADPELRERFKLEATAAAAVESEHIVQIFDAGVDAATGTPYLVMELLRGEELGAMLERKRRFAPSEVVLLLGQAALALERTHAAGIVHRDLKPENLFVTYGDDGSPRVKVLDFGIAKLVAQSAHGAAKTTRSLGTPLYMSPEQVRGDPLVGPRADLYALGHIAFTLLVGRPYWEADAVGEAVFPLLTKVVAGAQVPATRRAELHDVALPIAFDAWFSRSTAPSPGDRFESADAQILALAEALGEPPPRTHARSLPPSTPTALSPTPSPATSKATRSATPVASDPLPSTTARRGVLWVVGAGALGVVSLFAIFALRAGHAPAASSSDVRAPDVAREHVVDAAPPTSDARPIVAPAAPADAASAAATAPSSSVSPRVPRVPSSIAPSAKAAAAPATTAQKTPKPASTYDPLKDP